jgi:hypothetical protein
MDHVHEDCFVLFVRGEPGGADGVPELAERALATCRSYAEARRARRLLGYPAHACTIRYVGPAGGGD